MSEPEFEYTGDFPVAERAEFPNGIVATIRYEEDSSFANPRECDQLAHLAVSYPGYELGDEQLPRDGFDPIDCPNCDATGEAYGPVTEPVGPFESKAPDCPHCDGMGEREPTVEEWLRDRGAEVAAPLFVYEHSGITIKDGAYRILEREDITRGDIRSSGQFVGDDAGWDTSFVGFVYVTRERALELGIPGTTSVGREANGSLKFEVADEEEMHKAMIEQAEGEVREYARWLEGDVYWYLIEDEDGEHMDSCGGFIGIEYAEEEARSAAEIAVEEVAKERTRVAEWEARGVRTVKS